MIGKSNVILDESENAVKQLVLVCDKILEGKFVTVDADISELLMIIAKSSRLQKIVADCVKGFDFKRAYRRSIIKTGQWQSIVMPESRKEQVAYVVNLLYSLDTKQLDVSEFLSSYYYSTSGIGRSYEDFAKKLILPFKKSIEGEYLSGISGKYTKVDDIRLSASQVDLAITALFNLRKTVKKEESLGEFQCNQLITYIDTIGNAVQKGEYLLIAGAFGSLCNMAKTFMLSSGYYENENVMRDIFVSCGCI